MHEFCQVAHDAGPPCSVDWRNGGVSSPPPPLGCLLTIWNAKPLATRHIRWPSNLAPACQALWSSLYDKCMIVPTHGPRRRELLSVINHGWMGTTSYRVSYSGMVAIALNNRWMTTRITFATSHLHEQLIRASHAVAIYLKILTGWKCDQPPILCMILHITEGPSNYPRNNFSHLFKLQIDAVPPFVRSASLRTVNCKEIIAGGENEWWTGKSNSWFQDPHDSLASEFYWTASQRNGRRNIEELSLVASTASSNV
jgi:hypothetical protein